MNSPRVISRWRAGAVHLGLSALVAAAALVAIYEFWYPGTFFSVAGGRELLALIVGVDVVLGPLLTTIVFRQGKKGLAFDLAVIALVQLAALGYGTWVMFEARPVYVTFVRDRFELVRANELDPAELAKAKPEFAQLSLSGPRYAGVAMPKDPDEQFRIMVSGAAGVDIQRFPQHYVPYDAVRGEVRSRARPMSELKRLNPGMDDAIARVVAGSGKPGDALGFLPLRAGKKDFSVIVDTSNGDVVQIAELRPWEY